MHTFEAHYDDMFSQVGSDYLEAAIQKYQHPNSLLNVMGKSEIQDPLYGVMYRKIAHLVEPIDPVLGANSSNPHYNAFLRGSLPAIYVAKKYLTRDFRGAVEGRAIGEYSCSPEAMPKDLVERAQIQTELCGHITDAAERGWAAADNYHTVLDGLFGKVNPDVVTQITMQRGFGFVISLVVDTRQSRIEDDLAEIQGIHAMKNDEDLSDEKKFDLTDWDAAASELFAEEAAQQRKNEDTPE